MKNNPYKKIEFAVRRKRGIWLWLSRNVYEVVYRWPEPEVGLHNWLVIAECVHYRDAEIVAASLALKHGNGSTFKIGLLE